MKSQLMYLELKLDGVRGPARIGRVGLSKTGRTLYYAERTLAPLGGAGLKANYVDTATMEELWISRPRADGNDSLYPTVVEVDPDCRDEYWREVRRARPLGNGVSHRSPGKSLRDRDKQEQGARRRGMDRRWVPSRACSPADDPSAT